MIEQHEEDIEEWYFDHKADNINKDSSGSSSLENFLCSQGRMLKTKSDRQCLDDGKNKKAKKTVSEYNGLFIAMGETEVLHGEALHPIKIIIEFPSKKHAHDWYESESYQKLISIRDQSMHSQFHII